MKPDPHVRDPVPHVRDPDPHVRDPDPHVRDPDPHMRDPDSHLLDLDAHLRAPVTGAATLAPGSVLCPLTVLCKRQRDVTKWYLSFLRGSFNTRAAQMSQSMVDSLLHGCSAASISI